MVRLCRQFLDEPKTQIRLNHLLKYWWNFILNILINITKRNMYNGLGSSCLDFPEPYGGF